ncbi:MAG: alpha/beta fold hydrolase [Planctomycetota bacterium]
MRAETLDLALSFVALMAVPFSISLCIWILLLRFRKDPPRMVDLAITSGIAIAITLCITTVISLIFSVTGFYESQFFRPSSKDYQVAKEQGLEPLDVTFESGDGTQLHGWILRSAAEPLGTIVHFHGSDRNITFTAGNVSWLTDAGFDVFAFDYRGYGRSEGTPSHEGMVTDSLAAIEFAKSNPAFRSDRLVLLGQSMGGQLAIIAAGRHDGVIDGVIADSTYAKRSHHLSDKLGRMGPLWLVKWGGWLFTSDEPCGESSLPDLRSSLLLIHGTEDRGVMPYHSERLFETASEPKQIWRVDGLGHLQVLRQPEHQKRLVGYLTDLLSAERTNRSANDVPEG